MNRASYRPRIRSSPRSNSLRNRVAEIRSFDSFTYSTLNPVIAATFAAIASNSAGGSLSPCCSASVYGPRANSRACCTHSAMLSVRLHLLVVVSNRRIRRQIPNRLIVQPGARRL